MSSRQATILGDRSTYVHNNGMKTSRFPSLRIEFARSIDSEWFRHVLDPANYGEHIYEDSKKTAPYAVHVHADATCREMIANRPTSKIDYQRIKEILKAFGYNGYVSIEYVGNEDPNVAVPRLAKLLKDAFI